MPQIPLNNPQVSQGAGLDPGAVNLAKAIRQTESGGNFKAQGKSGEYGAYQWTTPTWQKMSSAAGINVPLQQATPEQQNQVAYAQIKRWKDQGYNVGQIASMWNAGEGEPNAYTGKFSSGTPSQGVNKYGVKFSVPQYAQSVASAYQTIKRGGQVGVDPNNPSSIAGTQIAPMQPQQQGGGWLQSLVDYGLPLVGTVAGGLIGGAATAPAFGVGALAGAPVGAGIGATAGASLAEVIDQLAGWKHYTPAQAALEPIAMGAATAATGGVSQALGPLTGLTGLAARTGAQAGVGGLYGAAQSGLEGGDMKQGALTGALFSGAANVAGEGIGAGLNKLAQRTPEGRLGQMVNSLTSLGNADEKFSSPMRDEAGNVVRDASGQIQFQTPSDLLAQEGLIQHLKVEDGKIQTEELASQIDNKISALSDEVSQRINTIAGKTTEDLGNGMTLQGEAVNGMSMDDFRNAAVQKALSDPRVTGTGDINKVLNQIDNKIAGLRAVYGNDVPWTDVNNIRVQMNKVYNPDTMDVERILGDTARDSLYSSSGDPELKGLLAKEGQLIQTQDFVKRLQGKAVKGGRLGKYFARGTGALVGGGVGTALGPLGIGGGALAGDFIGDRALNLVQSRYFNPIGANSGRVLSNFMAKPGVQLTGQAAKIAALRALLNGQNQ